jgi:two-component system, OmpR family, response regulator
MENAVDSRQAVETEPHILIVDDDRDIRDLLSRFLRKNGLRVGVAANGHEMKRQLGESKVDLVVLDRVMPGEDGLILCRELRANSRVPVIMLTLLNSDTDRIEGLETGADDYISKPFNPQELLARIRAVLRRANDLPLQNSLQQAGVLRFSGWNLDRTRRRLVSPAGVAVVLTDGEFDLLVAFAEHAQVVLSREQLLDIARGRSAIAFDRSIDMQITRLRRKIEIDPDEPGLIKTIRNKGYVFTPEVTGGTA